MQFLPVFLLVALPWLNPFAPGPSPAIVPLLFSWFCAAILLALSGRLLPHGQLKSWPPEVAWAWLAAGLLSSAMGLYQYFGADTRFLPWINQTSLGEAFANLRQRNQFASLTNIALMSLIWIAAFCGKEAPQLDSSKSRRIYWQIMLSAALLAMGNASSASRTGLLQLILISALCGIWGLWRQRLVRNLLITSVIAYTVATLALPWLAGFDLSLHGMSARLYAGDSVVCSSRLTLWSNVVHLIAQKPWWGWGWGELDYAHYITLYEGLRFCEILDNAHNLPLHLAVERGLPASLAVCGGFTWWVLRQKPWREVNPTRQLAWSVIAVILLHSMLEYPLWYGPFQMAFGLCIVMLWLTRTTSVVQPKLEKNTLKNQSFPIFKSTIAIVFIACIVYAAWDYRRISQIYMRPALRDAAYSNDTLEKIRGTWLFDNQVRFAELNITPLTRTNAEEIFLTATAMLHYSPEPRVIEKIIESSLLLGLDGVASAHIARYRAAFPAEYARWVKSQDASTTQSASR